MTIQRGARADGGDKARNLTIKWVFVTNFWFLVVLKPIFNGFSPFLGVIG
jgi:hypothetical protein